MNTLTKKLSQEQIASLYRKLRPLAVKESRPAYTSWQLKTRDMTVTAYTSGSVVFQGKDVSWLAEDSEAVSAQKSAGTLPAQKKTSSARSRQFPMAGSDEVGTGDYFGPVVVAAAVVPDAQIASQLHAMHITDSKAMTDAAILKAAPVIAKMIPYTVEILSDASYNRIYDRENMNINRIKALMHNKAWLHLADQITLPSNCIVDQFCAESTYYRHIASQKTDGETVRGLYFETKAESRYIAVAAASVLARAAFLEAMQEMDTRWNFHFEKGAGSRVDACGRKFLRSHPISDLSMVAKLHFANTAKIFDTDPGSGAEG